MNLVPPEKIIGYKLILKSTGEDLMDEDNQKCRAIDKSFKTSREIPQVESAAVPPEQVGTKTMRFSCSEPNESVKPTHRSRNIFQKVSDRKRSELIAEMVDELKIDPLDKAPIANYAEYTLEAQLKDLNDLIISCNQTMHVSEKMKLTAEDNIKTLNINMGILISRKKQVVDAMKLIK